MDDLAHDLREKSISTVLYAGNNDMLAGHFGLEAVIQNISLGYTKGYGFKKRPETPWYNDDGDFAGIIHQERNLTYVCEFSTRQLPRIDRLTLSKVALNGGHQLAASAPDLAFAIARDYFFGDDELGLYDEESNTVPTEPPPKALQDNGVIVGQAGIIYNGTSLVAPKKTIASWEKALAAMESTDAASVATSTAEASTTLTDTATSEVEQITSSG